jgi:hypothetical protein
MVFGNDIIRFKYLKYNGSFEGIEGLRAVSPFFRELARGRFPNDSRIRNDNALGTGGVEVRVNRPSMTGCRPVSSARR